MKIKKRLVLLGASICMFSSFFVNAQSGVYVKGPNSTKEIENGSLHIKSSSKTEEKEIDGLVISNGNKNITIGKPSNPGDNNGNNGGAEITIKGVVTAVEGLNVRSGPSTSYSILGTLKYKESMEIVETANGWHKIKYNGGYGYVSASYVNTDGSFDTGNETPTTPTKIKKIVIDPGHGGSDPGAIGPNGLREKDVVLDVSLKLRDILQKNGYSTVMTRTTDVYLTLQQRVDISNSSNADFFLSVHNNSFSNPSANGTETFSYQSTGFGADVARKIQSKLVSTHGLTNRGFKTEAFYVLKYNKIPAALVEIAFISNPYEESLLANDAFRTQSAQAIADAIMSFK